MIDLGWAVAAMVVTVIASQGRAYAERHNSAGVAVYYVNYPGVTHTFFGMSEFWQMLARQLRAWQPISS